MSCARIVTTLAALGLTAALRGESELQWMSRYDGHGSRDIASDAAVDPEGSVHVAGRTGERYVLVKYGAGGEEHWRQYITLPTSHFLSWPHTATSFASSVLPPCIRNWM